MYEVRLVSHLFLLLNKDRLNNSWLGERVLIISSTLRNVYNSITQPQVSVLYKCFRLLIRVGEFQVLGILELILSENYSQEEEQKTVSKKSTMFQNEKEFTTNYKFVTADKSPQASQIQKYDRIVTYKMPFTPSFLP